MAGTCLIISGGEFCPYIPENTYDLIIACDRGYEYAEQLNVLPDVVIGDFDSYDGAVRDGIEVITLPTEKDDTDTLHAARYALQLWMNDITICCAMGGRLDHAFANIQTGAYIASCNASCRIITGKETIYFIASKSITIKRSSNRYFSVFSLTDKCTGVNISGAKYPLRDYEISNVFPIGTSNEWLEDAITVGLSSGIMMIIC